MQVQVEAHKQKRRKGFGSGVELLMAPARVRSLGKKLGDLRSGKGYFVAYALRALPATALPKLGVQPGLT